MSAAIPRVPHAAPMGLAPSAAVPRILFGLAIITGILFLGLVLYAAQFSGAARWLVGIAFVGLLATTATYLVLRQTGRPEPFGPPPGGGDVTEGELTALAGIIARATRGMPFSQSLLAGRLRGAFIERVRSLRGLSPEAMRELESDPDALGRAVGDDVLARFLLETQDRDGREAWAVEARRGPGFPTVIEDLLGRMEAWR